MPFFLIIVGLLLVVVAVRDNQDAFYSQLGKDFTGQNSFTNWGIAVLGVGALGYYKPIKPIVDPFILLMIIGFLISNAGGLEHLLPQLQEAFQNAKDQLGGSGGVSSISNTLAGAEQSLENQVNQVYGNNQNPSPQQVLSPSQAQEWEQANGLPVLK